jgi:Cu/Ag efflux pump CusA
MARRFVFERGDEVRERVAFGILIILLIFLFAFTFAVLGKGEYEPAGEAPPHVPSGLA